MQSAAKVRFPPLTSNDTNGPLLLAQVKQTRINAIIVAHRYSTKNIAIFAISFFAGLRLHLICALPALSLWQANAYCRGLIFLHFI
jgi:hypothetical protein